MLKFRAPVLDGTHGTVHSAVLLDSNALALFGSAPAPLPAAGVALFAAGDDSRGIWRAVHWPRAGGQFGFFALLGVASVTQLHSGIIRVAQDASLPPAPLPPLGRVDVDPALMIEALRAEGAPTAPVIQFLHDAAGAPDFAEMPGIGAFLAAALDALSRQSGFVEIVARPEYGGVLIQGWSCDLQPGTRTVILQHDVPETRDGVVATFARDDLLDSARGIIAYFKDASGDDALALRRVYFAAGEDCVHLEAVPEPVRLQPGEAVAHLEHMLPALDAEEPVRRAFRRICRPRFHGANTMESVAAPVRLSVDCALHVPGTGFLLTGWLLDPRQETFLVLLKSTGNFYCRLHELWHRTPRPDVIAGFAADPLFAPFMAGASPDCGFLVFVPHEEPLGEDERFYVELVLKDETCGFAPVRIDDRPPDVVASSVLGTVNVDDLAFESLIKAHLGPIVGGAFAARAATDSSAAVFPFGGAKPAPPASIVLAATGGAADIDINLSRLAGDPDLDGVELVIVASQATLRLTPAQLREWAEFYGRDGKLVVAAGAIDYFEALELGARHAASGLLAFLADTVLPDAPGWLGALTGELDRQPGAAAISPTLLYEDMSIRYAGLPEEETPSLERNGLRQLTGYPLHWLAGQSVALVHGVSEHCMVIRRAAFERMQGFSREFTAADFKAVDFALRLREAGLPMLWTPSVTLYSLDGGSAEEGDEYWRRPARKIDAWRLARKWEPAVAGSRVSCEVVE